MGLGGLSLAEENPPTHRHGPAPKMGIVLSVPLSYIGGVAVSCSHAGEVYPYDDVEMTGADSGGSRGLGVVGPS
jgi:hypothetical protein